MEQKQRSYERNMRKWDRERRVKAAAGLDTTKEDYWYKYNKMRLKELVDASNGYLKRDYSAEKIGGTKGRPYKPVRIPKKSIEYKGTNKEEGHRGIVKKATVDRAYINSSAYKSRYKGMTNDPKINKILAREAVAILKHRQGTLKEDLVYINPENMQILRNRSHSVDSQVPPTEKMRALLKANPEKIIAIHNHPESSVPSAPDLYAAVNYDFGIVAAHNGVIFKYSVNKDIEKVSNFTINYQLDYLQQSIYNGDGKVQIQNKELERILKRLEDIGIKMEVIA